MSVLQCVLLCVCPRTQIVCYSMFVFFLMIRRPPRSTLDRSSAASDVYKRQEPLEAMQFGHETDGGHRVDALEAAQPRHAIAIRSVSYTHLRAHETVLDLVCRLLLEKKTRHESDTTSNLYVMNLTGRMMQDMSLRHIHKPPTTY